jgi:uncharacterized protein
MRAALTLVLGGLVALGVTPGRSLARAPARQAIPARAGAVVDRAGALEDADLSALAAFCKEAAASGDPAVHLQFLIVPSLGGEDMDAFAERVARVWKLAQLGKNGGVLVVWARDERLIRIEVGGELYTRLSPFQTDRIIQDVMARSFQAGRFGEGLLAGAKELVRVLRSPSDEGDPERRL